MDSSCGPGFPLLILVLSFRLHDSADYPWRPAVSHSDFQKLLHNLTAIKIRGTYSERSTYAAALRHSPCSVTG